MCLNKFVSVVLAVLVAYFLYSNWYFEMILPQILPEEAIPEDYSCRSFVTYVQRCCEFEDGSGYCALFVD